jgi:dTDP-glucose 4,6-dehydratase
MHSLLVTGGAGFIGTNFVQYWHREHAGDLVVAFDALTYAANPANFEHGSRDPNLVFIQGNIRDDALVRKIISNYKIDTVVHFAAESHVDRSIVGPDAFMNTNVIGTHGLLKAAREVWSKRVNGFEGCRFHHVSTDEVFGSLGPNDPASTETARYAPSSPYAASKAASDHLVRAYHKTYSLPVTITACSNNYGPYQFPEKLVPLVIINALQGKQLPIYGDGGNLRDWLYVEDHCRAIDLVLERGCAGESYNIGGDNQRTNLELVTEICYLLDKLFAKSKELRSKFPDCPAGHGRKTETLLAFVPDRPGHDRRYAVDAKRARSKLGFTPAETLGSGMVKTVEWYIEHESWWRSLLKGRYRHWIKRQYNGLPHAHL